MLNRHPTKITKDKKFEIFGGGYVEKIEPIDDQGNVVAHALNELYEFCVALE